MHWQGFIRKGEMVPRRGGVRGWSPKGASELVTHLEIRKGSQVRYRKRESILTALSQLNKKKQNICMKRGRVRV